MEKRLAEHHFPHTVETHLYPYISHYLLPMKLATTWIFKTERKNKEGCAKDRADAWKDTLNFWIKSGKAERIFLKRRFPGKGRRFILMETWIISERLSASFVYNIIEMAKTTRQTGEGGIRLWNSKKP